jgi:hypothetical protein
MIKTTDLYAAFTNAQVTRRAAVPAFRTGSSGLVVRMRGWRPAGIAISPKHGFAATDSAPERMPLL